ncbi:FAD binding domain-containing protein [Candidatus Poriferisocius sp.]|uniref:FAD binding domain-containing protein n=1 Tax=Candidatus Poriferisocius sp. TaxID=3101276 RepID=UPI003B02C13F
MKPPPFLYARPESIEEAVAVLVEHGDEARPLAGGQSLVPMLNYRLARPEVLVDLARVETLRVMTEHGGGWSVGATTTHAELGRNGDLVANCGLVGKAVPYIGHLQIRARGTVGGSVAHADPAAELPAVALAVDATVVAEGPGGRRNIAADEFFVGPYANGLAEGELLVSVEFPKLPVGTLYLFDEFARRKGDFAVAGIAGIVEMSEDGVTVGSSRLTAFGIGGTPARLRAAEEVLVDRVLGQEAADEAGAAAAREVEPWDDNHGPATFRRQLISTMLRRSLMARAA